MSHHHHDHDNEKKHHHHHVQSSSGKLLIHPNVALRRKHDGKNRNKDFITHKHKHFPSSHSLRDDCPPPYDQGHVGSCTANSICAAIKIHCMRQGSDFEPSRMYVYYKERLIEAHGGAITDSGADAQDGLDYIKITGVCREDLWPYIEKNDDVAPPKKCDQDAPNHRIVDIKDIDDSSPEALHMGLKSAIHSHGLPVCVGIMVYESFQSPKVAQTGIVPMPGHNEQCEGGHEVLIVGYDDDKQRYMLLNSWGSKWGDQGFFYLPYAYLQNHNLAHEFRAVTGIELLD